MPASATLIVTIENAGTEPVEGATVWASPAGGRRVRLEETGGGQYRASGLAPGACELRASRRGYLTDTYEVNLRPGLNSIGVVLGRRGERYYYASGLKVYFKPIEDRFLVAAYGDDAPRQLEDLLRGQGLTPEREAPPVAEPPPARDSSMRWVRSPGAGPPEADEMASVRAALEARGLQGVPALAVVRGDAPPQGLTDQLLVQFGSDVDEEQASGIAAEAGLEIVREVRTVPNGYLLRAPEGPTYALLDVAQDLLDRHPVVTAEPELLMQLEVDQYTPNDPLFNLLTHLPLVRCHHAWAEAGRFLGSSERGGSPSICIAVFDPHGVAANHPEFTVTLSNGATKLVRSFNFQAMANQTVAALGGDHGTQSAGTATAAFDNGRGIAGVAPNCRMIGARIPNPATGTMMADAFLWAAGIDNGNTTAGFPVLPAQPADVISNSWGVTNAALSTALREALDRLTDVGRDGRGCIVTFSTGNLGYVQFSNARRFASYERTVAVGASINTNPTSPVTSFHADPNGNTNNLAVQVDTRALYSPFGPELDIVAPSHTCYNAAGNIVDPTTSSVRVGTGNLNGCPAPTTCNDYETSFGGTSHSSPTIAGTAALVLSIWPILSWDEARAVLRRTAVRIDAGQANAIGQYVDLNGDGIAEFSQWYGYGRVNVDRAVDEAAKLAVATYAVWS